MPLDLIFFAAVAVFLGWRLYAALGQRNGTEKRIDPFARAKNGETQDKGQNHKGQNHKDQGQAPEIVSGDARLSIGSDRERRQIESAIAAAPDSVRRALAEIKSADSLFDVVDFIEGAKAAFEMILNAYAKGDTAALRSLLSDEIYANFGAAIEDRRKNGNRLEVTLIGITNAIITDAAFQPSKGEARIAVRFDSQQVTVTKDSEGRIVDGDPNEIAIIADLWTFARQVKSKDPNWTLVATESL